MSGILRVTLRLIGFLALAFSCCADFVLRFWITGRARNSKERSQWTFFWGKMTLRLMGVKLTVHGPLPQTGLLASNHLSYVDICAYAACQPFVFVSKSQVKWWPIVGLMTQCAGTLFINREQRSDVKRLAEAFAPIIEGGSVVALYPEGTSSGGDRVLPFHSSLFEPAASRGWTVTPAWIGYEVPGGDASEQVAYWKDMTFLPHLLQLFRLKEIRAIIRFGAPLPPGLDRKQMARQLHEQVCALAAQEGRVLIPSTKPATPLVSARS